MFVCSDCVLGLNEVGMVCWRVKLAIIEYSKGCEIIFVVNDIMYMFGFLFLLEDSVYCVVFDFVVVEGLLCVYISFNSGVRIGFDEVVKAAFRVKWVDDDDVFKGFKYIYFSEDDYEILFVKGWVKVK